MALESIFDGLVKAGAFAVAYNPQLTGLPAW